MYKFLPFMTNDYSIGLFDEDFNDIYHSAFGALSEAYEKFIYPILNFIDNCESINVLDICYGIGYNTKALLNKCLNKNIRINIDCVDYNQELIKLSPFIKSKISFTDRIINKKLLYKNISGYKEAKKIINIKNRINFNENIQDKINFILLENMVKKFGIDFLDDELEKLIYKRENSLFFDKGVLNFYKFLKKNEVYLLKNKNKSPFVHNIYYEYISKRYKYDYNLHQKLPFDINFYPLDVRKFIVSTNKDYDFMFLDGFTPAKCPCIWSYEFIQELYNHIKANGVLVTYNSSAVVHNTLKSVGFHIGNILDKNNNITGTIASKNISNIKYSLYNRQEGLLNTRAGIMYHDYNLSADNDTIYLNRQNEFDNSDLMSSSKYLKGLKE